MNNEETTPNTDEQVGGAEPTVAAENQAAAESNLGNATPEASSSIKTDSTSPADVSGASSEGEAA